MPTALPDTPETLIRRAAKEAVQSAFPNLDGLPPRLTRRAGADALRDRLGFPVSHRSLEAWPLTWRRVNGKAVCETAELFAAAQAKLDAAPPIRGGRTPTSTSAE